MIRPTRILIDLKALRANLRRVRETAPAAQVLAIVKANGYGHGLIRTARALASADGFGVASIDEALLLREAGIGKKILLLEGFLSAGELSLVDRQRLDVVVHQEFQLEILERARLARPLSVWLKLDTGMHRLGFPPHRLLPVWQRLRRCPQVARPLRLMSHLANADDRQDQQTVRQHRLFLSQAAALDEPGLQCSIANSAAILGWPATHLHWVRPGIMLYGISPFGGETGSHLGLQPVMTLTTRLIAVKRVPRGAAVGYGGTWVCPEDMPVGVAAVGYGDGYPRHLPSGTPVLVNGCPVPLVGRVSMDMITVDLRTQPAARPGDPVQLWGRELPVEEVAWRAGTIPYELVCQVTGRVECEAIDEEP